MKKLLVASVSVLAMCFGAAAADLPVKAPPVPAAAAYGDPWSGFYIGGAVGYGWDRGGGTGSAAAAGMTSSAAFDTSPQGFVGGLHLGRGSRIANNWYIGGEVAGGIGTLDGTQQNPGFALGVNSKTHALFSVSGRLGYIFLPNAMIYGRGGWSWATTEFTATDAFGNNFSTKPVLDGPMLGAGVEFAMSQNWLLGVEYQHYFLGDINASTAGSIVAGNLVVPAVFSARVSNNIDDFLLRLSYKF